MDKEKKDYELKNPAILLLYMLVIGSVVNSIIVSIQRWLAGGSFFASLLPYLLASLRFLSTLASIFFATGLVYSTIRLTQLRKAQAEALKKQEDLLAPTHTLDGKPRNLKWERVVAHSESDNPGDWRLAILEADILLDEMTMSMGYHGETLGDRLKGIEKSDFTTIDMAWEAHKVRNQIAHEGSDFLITQREAKRVVGLYRRVFEEFRYI